MLYVKIPNLKGKRMEIKKFKNLLTLEMNAIEKWYQIQISLAEVLGKVKF